MKIDYHKRAWQCPKCEQWLAVNRRKAGRRVRTCPHCKTKVLVVTAIVIHQTSTYEKEIITQPVEA